MLACTKTRLNGPSSEVIKTLEISNYKSAVVRGPKDTWENKQIGSGPGLIRMGHATSEEE